MVAMMKVLKTRGEHSFEVGEQLEMLACLRSREVNRAYRIAHILTQANT